MLALLLLALVSAHQPPATCPAAEAHRVDSTSVIRGFDLASNQWKYSLVDKWVELATFTSQRGDSGWVFGYDIPGATPRRLHIEWIATPAGYTEVIQVSPDSGRTWPIVRHLNYTRMPSTNVAQ
jgi:hypothetical protein